MAGHREGKNRTRARVRQMGIYAWVRQNLSLPWIGLSLYTFAFVTFRADIAIVGILIALLGSALRLRRIPYSAPLGILFAYIIWAFSTSVGAEFGDVARDGVIELLKLLVVFFVTERALNSFGRVRLYLWFLLGCFVMFPVRGVYLGGDSILGRAVWNYAYANPNALAAVALLAFGVALSLTFTSTSEEKPRWWWRLCAGLSAAAVLGVILLTQSRGALVGLVAAYTTAVLPTNWVRLKRLAMVLVAALILVPMLPSNVWERVAGLSKLTKTETIAQADREGSAAERLAIQEAGWKMLLDHWMVGVGLNGFSREIGRYDPRLAWKDAHNTYLSIAAETGLPGLAIWSLLMGSVMWRARRARAAFPDHCLSRQQEWLERGFMSYLVAGLFGSFGMINMSYVFLAMIASSTGALQALARAQQKRRS